MAIDTINNFITEYQRRVVDKSLPQWLRPYQDAGIERFVSLGLPGPKDEAWKYTSMKELTGHDYIVANNPSQSGALSKEELQYVDRFNQRLVFIKGSYSEEHSNIGAAGIEVKFFKDVKDSTVIKESLIAYPSENAFASLNKAFLHQAVWLDVKADVSIKDPIHVIHVNGGKHEALNPRLVVTAGKHSKVNVLQSYVSFNDDDYFTNAVTDIYAAAGATVDYCQLQAESLNAKHIATTRIELGKDSEVNAFNFSLGAKFTRNNTDAFLKEEASFVNLDGLYAVKDKQHVDNHSLIDHEKPNAKSHQTYKGVLAGESHAVFNGKVLVREGAILTDSVQLNKNLLLSKKSKIDTKPELDIANDDVKCAHGATVGQVNPEEIFYFQSRAIPEDVARSLLVRGFVADVFEKVKSDKVRVLLEELLEERYF
jgi:Fe-S cluster assembly protein SufD